MKSISSYIREYLKTLDADSAKIARIAMNNSIYRKAVESIWKDKQASSLILDETNAFYVRNDERLHKGNPEGKPYIVSEICCGDPLVRSELDTHKELLEFALRTNGLTFEELRIIPARRDMRKRHPFREQS